MFHSIRQNDKINDLYEKALRIVYSDYKTTFQELLNDDASFSVPHRNIQTLAMEIYKHILGLLPGIMGEVSKLIELYYVTSGHTICFPAEFLKQ